MPDISPVSTGNRSGIGFIALFAIFWCSLVGVFDYLIVSVLIKQISASRFEQAVATIVSSEVTKDHGGEGGSTYGVKIHFKYRVGTNEFLGEKYTFDEMTSSDSAWAYRAVTEHPVGGERVCYYNPRNPSEAILKPGIDGSQVFMLMFLTPFNAVGLFLIWVFLNSLRPEKIKIEPRMADPIRGVESYSMTVWSPWAAFFGGLTFGSFLGIFIVAFSFGFHPPMSRVLLVGGGV
jgi:hypothetical protein